MEFIKAHADMMEWGHLLRNRGIPISFWLQNMSCVDWSDIDATEWWYDVLANPNFPAWLITEDENLPYGRYWNSSQHIREFYWGSICENTSIPVWFLEKHIGELDWFSICRNIGVPIEFLESHIECLPWTTLCGNESIPTEFLERQLDKIDWRILCTRRLPEWFLHKYIGMLDWSMISFHCESVNFLEAHIDRVKWPRVAENEFNVWGEKKVM